MTTNYALSARQAAYREVARLERAQIAASASDARRVLSDERVELMAAIQRERKGQCDLDHLSKRTAEAARTREMWAAVGSGKIPEPLP